MPGPLDAYGAAAYGVNPAVVSAVPAVLGPAVAGPYGRVFPSVNASEGLLQQEFDGFLGCRADIDYLLEKAMLTDCAYRDIADVNCIEEVRFVKTCGCPRSGH